MDQTMDNRMNILRMIENRQITAEQGALLLANSGSGVAPVVKSAPVQPVVAAVPVTPGLPDTHAMPGAPAADAGAMKGRFFKVLVTDIASGKERVRVTLPLRLVDWGLRHGARFSDDVKNIDLDELNEIITKGESGKLIDVWDEENGEHVEITIE